MNRFNKYYDRNTNFTDKGLIDLGKSIQHLKELNLINLNFFV